MSLPQRFFQLHSFRRKGNQLYFWWNSNTHHNCFTFIFEKIKILYVEGWRWKVFNKATWGISPPNGKIPKLNTLTPVTGRQKFKITTGRDELGKYKDNFIVNSWNASNHHNRHIKLNKLGQNKRRVNRAYPATTRQTTPDPPGQARPQPP